MKYALGFVLWLVTISGAWADGMPGTSLGHWTNLATAGDKFLAVRPGRLGSVPSDGLADYQICNSHSSQSAVTVTTPSGQESVDAGKCSLCLFKPAFVRLQVGQVYNAHAEGTFEAFRPATSCGPKGGVRPKKLSVHSAKCSKIKNVPSVVVGHYSKMECVINLHRTKSKKREFYRLCVESLERRNLPAYDIGWARLIVDPSLANKRHDEDGIIKDDYSPTSKGCSDIYAANYLSILVGPADDNSSSGPLAVEKALFTLYRLDMK
ncbi:hypothetical protein [Aestuariivirga sp.]|uniref:hypothetical protein n=1 Tax=Aestuariivirga sp. TaxID=2650926 RepID=UPI0039E422BB